MAALIPTTRKLAEHHLSAPLPRRWRHVQAVGTKAERIAPHLPEADREALIAAAWLHDIGYAPDIAVTGFHPLDGARWLRAHGFDDRIVRLVAHHSCAQCEADKRDLGHDLAAEFVREESLTADALWYCDLTTGPDGQDFDVEERIAEIRTRYGPEDIVTHFIRDAGETLIETVRRVEAQLNLVRANQPM